MIDEALFQEFIQHRIDMKKPMSERAKAMLVKKLNRLELEGYCPNLLLEKAMIAGGKDGKGLQDVYRHEDCKKQHQTFVGKITDISWAQGLRK